MVQTCKSPRRSGLRRDSWVVISSSDFRLPIHSTCRRSFFAVKHSSAWAARWEDLPCYGRLQEWYVRAALQFDWHHAARGFGPLPHSTPPIRPPDLARTGQTARDITRTGDDTNAVLPEDVAK